MTYDSCPTGPEYDKLKEDIGEGKAFAAWLANGQEVPKSLQRAEKMLAKAPKTQEPIDWK